MQHYLVCVFLICLNGVMLQIILFPLLHSLLLKKTFIFLYLLSVSVYLPASDCCLVSGWPKGSFRFFCQCLTGKTNRLAGLLSISGHFLPTHSFCQQLPPAILTSNALETISHMFPDGTVCDFLPKVYLGVVQLSHGNDTTYEKLAPHCSVERFARNAYWSLLSMFLLTASCVQNLMCNPIYTVTQAKVRKLIYYMEGPDFYQGRQF